MIKPYQKFKLKDSVTNDDLYKIRYYGKVLDWIRKQKIFTAVEIHQKYMDLYPNTVWYYNESVYGTCYFTNDIVEPLDVNNIHNHPLTKIFK